jgi:ABC-type transport system involved in multi-copper enzyme maturation permease subunit
MTQTLAIFYDAYRELNAKKLFWIVLAISCIVVAAFGAVGISDKGITILWWEFPSGLNLTQFISPALFYKIMFANLGVKIWLTWIAAILALVSTASMIPDFISSGSIELALSKPIGRLRLFITKYLAGLLFVTLQVLVFTCAAFLVIGIRGKAWEPGLFWAVPLTVLCFSYVFCVCALLGLVTRSTIASLLLTLLLWFGVFGVHTTESTLLLFKIQKEMQVEKGKSEVARLEAEKKEFEAAPPEETPGDAATPSKPAEWPKQAELDRWQRDTAEVESSSKSVRKWHRLFYSGMTLLPKTSETIEVLERKLISDADLKDLRDKDDREGPGGFPGERIHVSGAKVQARLQDTLRSRSTAWVIGTSVAFEGVMLMIAGWIFCRRDF